MLERRLDNVVFRLRFASSRPAARQMVLHGTVFVNDRKVDIPSYQVKANDQIAVKTNEAGVKRIKELLESTKDLGVPSWLALKEDELKATVIKLPQRDDVGIPIKEQFIIELYSK
jgi:small subunit ribosomal protein S4